MLPPITELSAFIEKAGKATYAAGGGLTDQIERLGFIELIYIEGDFSYRDSYTGYYRSRGTEVVRYKNQPIWSTAYGGGIVKGKEGLVKITFQFLKKVMLAKPEGSGLFRGPTSFTDEDWVYRYKQDGDIEEFFGFEEIQKSGEKVFYHRIIGGTIVPL